MIEASSVGTYSMGYDCVSVGKSKAKAKASAGRA